VGARAARIGNVVTPGPAGVARPRSAVYQIATERPRRAYGCWLWWVRRSRPGGL